MFCVVVSEGSKGKGLAMSSLVRRVISTAKAPAAIGPYSQAVLVDRTINISGQLGMNSAGRQLVPGRKRLNNLSQTWVKF